MPDNFSDLTCNMPATHLQQVATTVVQMPPKEDPKKELHRISEISKVGVHLVKGGMPEDKIGEHLSHYAVGRWPITYEMDDRALSETIHMACQRVTREWFEPSKESFAEMVENWVCTKERQFSLQNGYNELRLLQPGEKKHFRTVLSRLVKRNVIKRSGDKSGVYKPIKGELKPEDWQHADDEHAPIWLPFDLSEMVVVPYGSIILIAGAPNSGKTATLMNIAYENQKKWDVHYYSSEISAGAFRRRAAKFPYSSVDDWEVSFYSRTTDFDDCIQPGKHSLNIIDYLEVHTDFYKVGKFLADIHANLDGAIAIVSLQKNPNTEVGRGGYHTLEKPQLAISLDHGKAKLVKCKEWDSDKFENPNHKEYTFKLVDGCRFQKVTGWVFPKKPEF